MNNDNNNINDNNNNGNNNTNNNNNNDRMDSCVEESFVIDSLPGITENPIHIDLRFGRDKRKTLLQETDKIGICESEGISARPCCKKRIK